MEPVPTPSPAEKPVSCEQMQSAPPRNPHPAAQERLPPCGTACYSVRHARQPCTSCPSPRWGFLPNPPHVSCHAGHEGGWAKNPNLAFPSETGSTDLKHLPQAKRAAAAARGDHRRHEAPAVVRPGLPIPRLPYVLQRLARDHVPAVHTAHLLACLHPFPDHDDRFVIRTRRRNALALTVIFRTDHLKGHQR